LDGRDLRFTVDEAERLASDVATGRLDAAVIAARRRERLVLAAA